MLNAVLGEGVKIHGAYEAAMGTAGKQMTSLVRLWQEAKNAIGEQFLPEMRAAIKGLGDLAKWAKENADTIADFRQDHRLGSNGRCHRQVRGLDRRRDQGCRRLDRGVSGTGSRS